MLTFQFPTKYLTVRVGSSSRSSDKYLLKTMTTSRLYTQVQKAWPEGLYEPAKHYEASAEQMTQLGACHGVGGISGGVERGGWRGVCYRHMGRPQTGQLMLMVTHADSQLSIRSQLWRSRRQMRLITHVLSAHQTNDNYQGVHARVIARVRPRKSSVRFCPGSSAGDWIAGRRLVVPCRWSPRHWTRRPSVASE